MSAKINRLVHLWLIAVLLLSACSVIPNVGLGSLKKVEIQIAYGSEKQDWLLPMIAAFNQSNQKITSGATIEVTAVGIGSIEAVDQMLAGQLQPTVWSPASSIYIPIANDEWRKTHSDDLVAGASPDLVLSPVVIAMWKPMAEALGWPNTPIGWSDIAAIATSDEGWEKYGYPEWGSFKFGHTHPEFSNSGIVSVIAQAYAGAGKQRGLTIDDLKKPELITFMSDVQRSIIHYGTSTGFFATRMFENGPSYLSAAVLYENLIVNQESKRLAGENSQLSVVAIYPKEGTFWANHPYAILNAPWVTTEQREAAEVFRGFLLAESQQKKAIEYGFRSSDPAIALTSPLDSQHGVDIQQPKTILEIPSPQVINDIQALWKETKKPVDLVIAVDVSGSMSGKKIAAARESLAQFIGLLDDRDRLEVITFSTQNKILSDLSELGPKREDITRRVSGLIEGGDTLLYDTVSLAYDEVLQKGDTRYIRAVVVLTDGKDTVSQSTFDDVIRKISSHSEDGGNAVKLFTIAYGTDADKDLLKNMAESTGGKQYDGSPETINQVYGEIATFF